MFYLTFLIEFSYWSYFGANVYFFLVGFYVLDIGIGMITEGTLCESLMIAPIDVSIGVIEGTMTMGAASFVDFTVSFLVDLSITMTDRLYLGPGLDWVFTLWPRWMMMWKRKFQARRRMTREEKAQEEIEWRRINEEIELSAEGVEPLLGAYSGYSVEVTAMMVFPAVNLFLMYFPNEVQITVNYGIKTYMSKYFLFAFYMPLFQLMLDVFILNSQELIYGWKVYDYVSYQRYRFSVRDHRWMMNSKVLDESIAESLQTLDLLCFSEQYYFLLALTSFAILLVVMGVTTFLRTQYNLFADPTSPEGAASGDLLERHRQIMDAIEEEIRLEQSNSEKKRKVYEMEQRGFFDRHEDLQKQVIADRRISAVSNIRTIRKETQNRIRNDEQLWQNEAARWLGTAKRKVELKKREDAEAAAAKRRRNR